MPAELDDPSPPDSPVGGGREYGDKFTPDDADEVVSTKSQLLSALEETEFRSKEDSQYVIFIDNNAKIDMTGENSLPLGHNVTLASGRGVDDARGALLYIRRDQWDTNPIFKSRRNNVRISGLRAEGPNTQYFDPGSVEDINDRATAGFWLFGENTTIDNCQLYGWTDAAIAIGAATHMPQNARIRYCSIHNNQMEGLGYGVTVYNGNPTIDMNYFDRNRHSIDGFGFATCGYKATANLVGPHPVDHAFDMHALTENISDYEGNLAGGTIIIERNTFQFNTHHRAVDGQAEEAIKIRGRPDDGMYIRNNRFYHLEEPENPHVHGQAYQQRMPDPDAIDGWENLFTSDNQFGTAVCGEIGVETPAQASREQWHTVSLRGVYQDPVVMMKSASYKDPVPCHIRLRNVESDSFEFQIGKWLYQDGSHKPEFLSYLVLETGTQRANNGTLIETGKTSVNHEFKSISFESDFDSQPVVLTQPQVVQGAHPAVTRNNNVTADGFDVRLQEEQRLSNGGHRFESVGYMAFEQGVINLLSTRLEVGRTPTEVTDDWYRVNFKTTRDTPAFLADIQTFNGIDTSYPRFNNLNKYGVDVKIDEEQSADNETVHKYSESVGYIVSEKKNGLI